MQPVNNTNYIWHCIILFASYFVTHSVYPLDFQLFPLIIGYYYCAVMKSGCYIHKENTGDSYLRKVVFIKTLKGLVKFMS